MKRMIVLTGIAGMLGIMAAGCAKTYRLDNDWGSAPGYTSNERYQQIDRSWDYEGKMATDDVDHFLLLRPTSKLTPWNVQ